MPRRILQGTVVSTKAAKTIVVLTETTKMHPVYGKTIRGSKKFHAHDEARTAQDGDVVQIIECAPKSALKRFELLKVVAKAGEKIQDSASDVAVEGAQDQQSA